MRKLEKNEKYLVIKFFLLSFVIKEERAMYGRDRLATSEIFRDMNESFLGFTEEYHVCETSIFF